MAQRAKIDPIHEGLDHHRAGRLSAAEKIYRAILRRQPRHLDALHLLGLSLHERGLTEDGLVYVQRAIHLQPRFALALRTLGDMLRCHDRLLEALFAYDRALQVRPDFVEALANRGNTLFALRRYDEALADYERVLALNDKIASVWSDHGNALMGMGRLDESLVSQDRAVAMAPGIAKFWSNRGTVLRALARPDEALVCYDRAMELGDQAAALLAKRGNALHALERVDEAAAAFDAAIALEPDCSEHWSSRGLVADGAAKALGFHERARELAPGDPAIQTNLGNTLLELERYDEAEAAFERATAIAPGRNYVLGNLLALRLRHADWHDHASLLGRVQAATDAGGAVSLPFNSLYWSRGAQDDRLVAGAVARTLPPLPAVWRGRPYRHSRIRLAYVSSDFRNHVTAQLMQGVIASHDRDRFETLAIDLWAGPEDSKRAALKGLFGTFLPLASADTATITQTMIDHEVDIAVDLNGHTKGNRINIFAHRSAPVQVSYLANPMTMALPYMDYILADRHVLPVEDEPFFTENAARLPFSYQPNDDQRPIAQPPTRASCGLPANGIVFCAMHAVMKINPALFDCWMRLLASVPGSVLWLLKTASRATDNLRREAFARGIDPARLVFADPVIPEQYLARLSIADLFLDAVPFNAHTTASDALWVGLPLITCTGGNFAGRVATSVLHAIGLPELATPDLAAYETLARELALDADRLRTLRLALWLNRGKAPLFDTVRHTRYLERAYTTMWERAEAGMPPESFDVPA
ncbi:Predicted O-linked N-acetylglucosamine transferase, SPINDLY family [Arboricoccus pini]|uniref:protein O-GlcNAc transferase n=1 Tax=Arboricoccus pini TaxID=1963835 RepID=A0A212S228_9PROT|nr:glycosyltransferase family 41 protein [Arboricoccus pini]SNB79182.1 Predicted O-linked N-acetylglucosamine transferase, SPINDLY family [Arboricoccus pini]